MENLWQKLMLGGSTAALATAACLTGAYAQSDTDIEQVVVSASRVTIAGYSQPTPVTVVGVAQLEKDAYSNITDAVRNLPSVNSPPSSNGNQNGGGFSGTEGVDILNLRNLGITRTLVLFDGQRVVQSNITGGVDVSTLPSSVVSRVDVVTGGASAAWGSDAVSGVVNFVLNKNFDGFKGDVEVSDTSNADYGTVKGQAAWGSDFLGGRGHFVFALEASLAPQVVDETHENWYRGAYYVSNPAYAAGNGQPQLIIANDVGIANANQGGIIVSSPAGTGAAVNALRGIEFTGNGNTQLVNFGNVTNGALSNGGSLTTLDGEQQFTIIAIPQNRYTAFAYGRYKLTDTVQASLQLNYGYTTTKSFAQPEEQAGNAVIHSDNAFLPASVKAAMTAGGITSFSMGLLLDNNYPMNGPDSSFFQNAEASLGPAIELSKRQLMRVVGMLDGTLGEDWSWNAYYQHSTVNYLADMINGDTQTANVLLAEDAVTVTAANRGTSGLALGSIACRSTLTSPANACVPLNVFGNGVASTAAIRYINYYNPATGGYAADYEDMELNQDTAEGSMQGTLPWQLPAGKVAVAFGVGYRKEAGENRADPRGAATAFNTSNFVNFPSSSYNVIEGFGEVDAPILKDNIVQSLDFSAAGRMTSYSTSGLVETWKLGLTSQINDDVRLRTTWSVDIRAPTLNELFVPATISNGSTKDPKTGSTQSVFTNVTGNPNLVPEVARTISAGVVLTPHWVDGLNLSVDYYSINLTGNIATITTALILATCTTNANDPLCTHLVFGGTNGALSNINNAPLNLQSISTSGFDIQGNYTMDFWDGSLAWSTVANYTDEITLTQIGSATDDYAGVMGAGSPPQMAGNPKWKGILSASYSTGPYSVTVQTRWFGTGILNNQWVGGNQITALTANFVTNNEVPFTAYLDLRGSYKWNDHIQIYGAVDNATDVPPPLIALSSNNTIHAVPTSNSAYDLLGRVFRLGIRVNY